MRTSLKSRRGGLALFLAAALGLPFAACWRGTERPQEEPAPRRQTLLSGPWRFLASNDLEGAERPDFDDAAWSEVRVPHTWGKDRYRSAWYRTRFRLAAENRPRRVYLRFEGVAALAEVYLNGTRLGAHNGAYTAFAFDATQALRSGENVLALRVNNSAADTADSLPSGRGKQLYHVYGGIYRKAWLIETAPLHVDPLDLAGPGVYVRTRRLGPAGAEVEAKVRVRNADGVRRFAEVRVAFLDAAGKPALELSGTADMQPAGVSEVWLSGRIREPRLWSPSDPYLYLVATELRSGGRRQDHVVVRTGLREFAFQGERFLLNGGEVLLRGVGKHQETEKGASAITDAELREDFRELKELGVNMVRLAHYPHAALAYDLADELGLLVWAENGHSSPWRVKEGVGELITREMVRQHYNHPSVVIWSAGNEVAFRRVGRYARTAKREDPSRVIAYASNTGGGQRERYPELDLVAHNTYRGWYNGAPWEIEKRLLDRRYVSETGGGAVVSSHTDYADARHEVDVFEPEEYRQLIAEAQCQLVFREHARQVPMYLVWILRDFAWSKYKGLNTKGLLTYAGFRKDAFYLYQSFLRPELPVVHIASKTYFLRRGRADNGVKAYSNRERLELFVNGESRGVRENGRHAHANGRSVANVFYWPARLHQGRNEIRVSDGQGHEDRAVVYFEGAGGLPAARGGEPLVSELQSSNPASAAFFVDAPALPQWPFYWEFDGSADNSFDAIPPAFSGASFISTPRLSKPQRRTELSFRASRDAEVGVMFTRGSGVERALAAAGFEDTGYDGRWRDNEMRLVACGLLRRTLRAGERVRVPAAVADYVVLVKPAQAAAGAGEGAGKSS